MRKVGNVVSNQIYNPENRKAPVPIDADEADSAMERFVRQKYIHNVAAERPGKPRSPLSDEGTPPPLPPKNTSKFNFRSASSIFPLSSKAKREARMANARGAGPGESPQLTNKPSKLFGSTVDYDAPDDTDKKLTRLREMGFHDTQRNAIILKGVNGNVDRAVESLVRLGEGDRPPPAPPKEKTLRATRSLTPMTPSSSTYGGAGLSAAYKQEDRPTSASTTSTNPFDMLSRAQPQTAQSTGSLQSKNNPYNMSTNPFASMASSTGHIDQAFQNMTIAGQRPGISPSPSSVASSYQGQQPQLYQHSAPASPQSYQGLGLQNNMSYAFAQQVQQQPQQQQPQQQQQQQPIPIQSQPTGYNPFFSQPSSPAQRYPVQSGLPFNTYQATGQYTGNPYARSPVALGQIPEQGQGMYLSTSPLPLASPGTNPFFSNQGTMPAAGNQQTFIPQQQYQPPPRHDKASIMALYGQMPTNQHKPASFEPQFQTQTPVIPENQAVNALSTPAPVPQQQQQPRSFSQPLPGTNPYASNGPGTGADQDPFGTARHVSRESMNLGMDMAWTNGRHSPDAFASLSARHV